jgi:segregation and condensation protein A
MTRQLEPRNHGNAPVPIAQVAGAPLLELPTDLYIPPDALEVVLETFEGPLDLLLYLIRRQNLDILDIRVAEVTRQYMEYIGLMAALLAEIKSRMLLPRSSVVEEDEDDPRAQLIRRLQEYERFKTAAEHIQDMPRMERDVFAVATARPQLVQEQAQPHVEMSELLVALAQALSRAEMFQHHSVQLEPMSVRDRMTDVLAQVNAVPDEFVPFVSLFRVGEHRMGVIVSFLAVMELLREGLVDLVQREPYAPIYLRSAQA